MPLKVRFIGDRPFQANQIKLAFQLENVPVDYNALVEENPRTACSVAWSRIDRGEWIQFDAIIFDLLYQGYGDLAGLEVVHDGLVNNLVTANGYKTAAELGPQELPWKYKYIVTMHLGAADNSIMPKVYASADARDFSRDRIFDTQINKGLRGLVRKIVEDCGG